MRRLAAAVCGALLAAFGTVVPLMGFDAFGAHLPRYRLPWAAGPDNAELVLQGNHRVDSFGACRSGCGSHADVSEWYAWDFDLPAGTPVLAARGGRVALVDDDWPAGHCGALPAVRSAPVGTGTVSNIGNEANFVQIDHGDGTSALYLHLSRVDPAILAKALTRGHVSAGERLGWSGRTGNTGCHAHLHFQVEYTVAADWFTYSVPVRFVDRDVVRRHPDGIPVEGETYASDNRPRGSPQR